MLWSQLTQSAKNYRRKIPGAYMHMASNTASKQERQHRGGNGRPTF